MKWIPGPETFPKPEDASDLAPFPVQTWPPLGMSSRGVHIKTVCSHNVCSCTNSGQHGVGPVISIKASLAFSVETARPLDSRSPESLTTGSPARWRVSVNTREGFARIKSDNSGVTLPHKFATYDVSAGCSRKLPRG
ncbi:hypothetical protein PoB_004884700, partial [Plakobranchus ocellatus]